MVVPVKNIVEQVDLTSEDVLLPLHECVVNAIISLQQSCVPIANRKIQIHIERGESPQSPTFDNLKTIRSFKIIDNGNGFNKANYKSFETPFSQINKDFGCKGIGRFTVLAAYGELCVDSTFLEDNKWKNRIFKLTKEKELEIMSFSDIVAKEPKTIVEMNNCNHSAILEKSAMSVKDIAESVMQHCLVYYLSGVLPRIEIFDRESGIFEVINDLFAKVSKDKEETL